MSIPWSVRKPVRRVRNTARNAYLVARQLPRWRALAATPLRRDALAVSYGYERMPAEREVYGGRVKFALLDEALPNEPLRFNVVYLGSTALPPAAALLVRLARRRGAAFAWNQNGVAYPAWHGPGWELVNAPRARLLHDADHVFFQSAFCKLGADRFYGERLGPWEVLHNPVDTRRFAPPRERERGPLRLLLGGNQYQRYRLETALETLALVRVERKDARLLVTGVLSFAPDADAQAHALAERLGLVDAVEFLGSYTQAEAPRMLARGDLLLHTKVADPCPTVVLETMALGLPVVYSATGGTPELVGEEAGVGVPGELDWERDHPPSPRELAAGVQAVAARLEDYAAAARERALRFDVRAWVERHREVFEMLRTR